MAAARPAASLRGGIRRTHDHVIRIAPSLVITREELDWALDRLERVLTTL